MHKLSHLKGSEWVAHTHPHSYAVLESPAGIERLVAGAPGGDAHVFERLVVSLKAPYILLYVLHTPRGEGEPGRYESPELSVAGLGAFLERFRPLLSNDARFDLWAHSPAEQATVVWDRHNQLFAYGPLDRYAAVLRALGFREGPVECPLPHQHHYRAEYDALAKALLDAYPWSVSPLLPEDEQ